MRVRMEWSNTQNKTADLEHQKRPSDSITMRSLSTQPKPRGQRAAEGPRNQATGDRRDRKRIQGT